MNECLKMQDLTCVALAEVRASREWHHSMPICTTLLFHVGYVATQIYFEPIARKLQLHVGNEYFGPCNSRKE